jgi:subtilisin family serine protease
MKALIEARREVGDEASEAEVADAFANRLATNVAELPWEVIQDTIEQGKGYAEYISENLLLGVVQSEIDPVVTATGELTEEAARSLIGMRYTIEAFLPVREQVAAVYQQLIDANRVDKPDIWADRSVTLDAESGAETVVVGIWDAGTDASVFTGSLWTNPNERFDGADSDGNGFVDDVHGIGVDVNGFRTSELLLPEGDMAGRVDDIMTHMKGFQDLLASVDSPESSELKRYLSNLQPGQVHSFMEGLSFGSMYIHGTHVAGIALEGNPFARILIARYTFDYHNPRRLLTTEIAERHAGSYQDTVDYFRQAGVRAVNMSWGWTLKEVEGILESNGVTDPEERAAKTRELFDILKNGLYDALASAPEILFITSAGNEDNDVEFDEVMPSSFELPNLIAVGAVDQAGDPTGFTSGGRNVVIYANGFEVESFVPGGGRMKASGTSMSSPNALNLAAKLLALDPSLTVPELIDLMRRGATPAEADPSMLLIHPQRSIELLQERAG